MRKTIGKVAAISVCFGLLLIAVPNANAVEKKAPRFQILKKPAMFINAVIPFFTSIFDSGKKSPDDQKTVKKVKITGDLHAHKISDGD